MKGLIRFFIRSVRSLLGWIVGLVWRVLRLLMNIAWLLLRASFLLMPVVVAIAALTLFFGVQVTPEATESFFVALLMFFLGGLFVFLWKERSRKGKSP